jgi:hypothetical protein
VNVATYYSIHFDDTAGISQEDEHDWDLKKVLKANKLYNKLQAVFKDKETQYLNERVFWNGWFGVVVEYLGVDTWRIQYDKGDEQNNITALFNRTTVQEAVRYFRALKEINDPTPKYYNW